MTDDKQKKLNELIDEWISNLCSKPDNKDIDTWSTQEVENWTLGSLESLGILFNQARSYIEQENISAYFWLLLSQSLAKRKNTFDPIEKMNSTYNNILKSTESGKIYLDRYFPHNYRSLMTDLYNSTNNKSIKESIRDTRNTVHERVQNLKQGISPVALLEIRTKSTRNEINAIISNLREHPHSLHQLDVIYSNVKTKEFDYLRKGRNILQQITGSYSDDHVWTGIMSDLKTNVISSLKEKIEQGQTISNDEWKIAEKIINEKTAITSFLFKDNYRTELQKLKTADSAKKLAIGRKTEERSYKE